MSTNDTDRGPFDGWEWTARPQPGQIIGKHKYTHEVVDEHGQIVASTLTEAQARLIAFAPNMLHALKNFAPYLPRDLRGADPLYAEAVDWLRAVIEDAEGTATNE